MLSAVHRFIFLFGLRRCGLRFNGVDFQAFCLYGATKLKVDDTDEAFIPDGSYLIDTNNARDT